MSGDDHGDSSREMWSCEVCGALFSYRRGYCRHMLRKHPENVQDKTSGIMIDLLYTSKELLK